MTPKFIALITAATAAVAFAATAVAQESGKTIRLPDLMIGTGNTGFEWTQDNLPTLEVNKAYRMWLKATGKKECAFQADELFANIKWRKMEINKVEIKPTASFKEIEFENEGSAELFFTPTKAGEYTWKCNGLEARGLTGKIVVK